MPKGRQRQSAQLVQTMHVQNVSIYLTSSAASTRHLCPQALASANAAGLNLLRENLQFRWLIVAPPEASAAASSTVAIASKLVSLRSAPSISGVERNTILRIPEPVVTVATDDGLRGGGVSPAATGIAAAPAQQKDTCTSATDPLNPDANLGRTSEGTPWGIKAVQANDPVVQQLALKFREKVMYCVLDSGLDISNQEFNPNSELHLLLRLSLCAVTGCANACCLYVQPSPMSPC